MARRKPQLPGKIIFPFYDKENLETFVFLKGPQVIILLFWVYGIKKVLNVINMTHFDYFSKPSIINMYRSWPFINLFQDKLYLKKIDHSVRISPAKVLKQLSQLILVALHWE